MTNEERNAMVEEYLPLVELVINRKNPREKGIKAAEIEDLRQDMYIILMRLVERYDPSRGATFRTYASSRLGFAIVDFIRSKYFYRKTDDHVSRWVHKPQKVGGFVDPNNDEEYDAYAAVATEDSENPDYLGMLTDAERIEHFRSTLDPTSKIVLDGLLEGLSLKASGALAGVSESRACQLRRIMQPHLKAYLENKGYVVSEGRYPLGE